MTSFHHHIVELFLFAFGAAVGSFLNLCIYRPPAGLSLIRPPSRCPECGQGIHWRDNVPILGWLALGGRCRSCACSISIRYPAVELLSSLIFAGIYWLGFVLRSLDPLE